MLGEDFFKNPQLTIAILRGIMRKTWLGFNQSINGIEVNPDATIHWQLEREAENLKEWRKWGC